MYFLQSTMGAVTYLAVGIGLFVLLVFGLMRKRR